MANLTPTSSWDNVYQFETSDPIQGGPGGVDNLPHKQLLNRTQWLYDKKLSLTGGTLTGGLTIARTTAGDSLGVATPTGVAAVIRFAQTGQSAGAIKSLAGGAVSFCADAGTGDTEQLRIDGAANRVLIGLTSSPSAGRLIVGGGATLQVGNGSDGADSRLGLYVTANGTATAKGFAWQLNATNGASLFVGNGSTAWNEAIRVNQAANVGIGTSSPAAKLDVNGNIRWGIPSSAQAILGYSNQWGVIRATTSAGADTSGIFIAGGGDVNFSRGAYIAANGNNVASAPGELQLSAGNVAGAQISFYTGGTLRAALTSVGRFGINAGSSPVSMLDVRQSSSALPSDAPGLAVFANNGAESSVAGVALIGGASGASALYLGDASSARSGAVFYNNSSDLLAIWAAGDSSGASGNRLNIGGSAGGVSRSTHPGSSDYSLQLATTKWSRDMVDGLTSASKTTKGWQKLPSGLILQWGKTGIMTGDSEEIATFLIPFPSACVMASATVDSTGNAINADDDFAQVRNVTTSNMVVRRNVGGGSSSGNGFCFWFAIGF